MPFAGPREYMAVAALKLFSGSIGIVYFIFIFCAHVSAAEQCNLFFSVGKAVLPTFDKLSGEHVDTAILSVLIPSRDAPLSPEHQARILELVPHYLRNDAPSLGPEEYFKTALLEEAAFLIARAVIFIQSSQEYSQAQIQRFNEVLDGRILNTSPKTPSEISKLMGSSVAQARQNELSWRRLLVGRAIQLSRDSNARTVH
jgi:hypothetical protein